LVNQRTVWCQRIHAELYQHGVAVPEGAIRTATTREMLADDSLALSRAARQRITVGYSMIDATDTEAQPLKRDLQRFGERQPACRALVDAQYGIGGLIAVCVGSELGDCRRFTRSQQAVRHTGLDVTVDASDRRRAGGFLSRQGPETLRWALYEAAKTPRISAAPTTTTTRRSRLGTTRRSPPSPSPANSLDAATTCCATSTRSSCTPSPPELTVGQRRTALPTSTSGSTAVGSCSRRARLPSGWTAFEH
jgi:Transposase IS116/IS110/IS902 family